MGSKEPARAFRARARAAARRMPGRQEHPSQATRRAAQVRRPQTKGIPPVPDYRAFFNSKHIRRILIQETSKLFGKPPGVLYFKASLSWATLPGRPSPGCVHRGRLFLVCIRTRYASGSHLCITGLLRFVTKKASAMVTFREF